MSGFFIFILFIPPDPAFYFDADPDLTSQNHAEGQRGSASIALQHIRLKTPILKTVFNISCFQIVYCNLNTEIRDPDLNTDQDPRNATEMNNYGSGSANQCCGPVSGLDPDSMGSLDTYPDSRPGSGSRRAKCPTNINFLLYIFLQFLVIKTLDTDWIRIHLKCWIQICIRIRFNKTGSTALKQTLPNVLKIIKHRSHLLKAGLRGGGRSLKLAILSLMLPDTPPPPPPG